MDAIFFNAECNGIPTRYSYQKQKRPRRKSKKSLRALSYIGSSLWYNLVKSLKTYSYLNTFECNVKDYYFRKGNMQE